MTYLCRLFYQLLDIVLAKVALAFLVTHKDIGCGLVLGDCDESRLRGCTLRWSGPLNALPNLCKRLLEFCGALWGGSGDWCSGDGCRHSSIDETECGGEVHEVRLDRRPGKSRRGFRRLQTQGRSESDWPRDRTCPSYYQTQDCEASTAESKEMRI